MQADGLVDSRLAQSGRTGARAGEGGRGADRGTDRGADRGADRCGHGRGTL